MTKFRIIAAAISFGLLAGSLAFGQDRGGQREELRYKNKGQSHGQKDRGPSNRHHDDRRGHDNRPEMQERRGAGPEHQFQRGSRLPAYYRQQIYVVNDWHNHRLPPPPRGHYWVQTGADYVLVAIATGIIIQLMLDYN